MIRSRLSLIALSLMSTMGATTSAAIEAARSMRDVAHPSERRRSEGKNYRGGRGWVYPHSSARQHARTAARQYMTMDGRHMQTMPARFVGKMTPFEYGLQRDIHGRISAKLAAAFERDMLTGTGVLSRFDGMDVIGTVEVGAALAEAETMNRNMHLHGTIDAPASTRSA